MKIELNPNSANVAVHQKITYIEEARYPGYFRDTVYKPIPLNNVGIDNAASYPSNKLAALSQFGFLAGAAQR